MFLTSCSPRNSCLADAGLSDKAQPPIGGKDQVERAVKQRGIQRFPEVRIGVNMLHLGRNGADLVGTAVQDGDVIASLQQPLNQKGPGGAGAADDQRLQGMSLLLVKQA